MISKMCDNCGVGYFERSFSISNWNIALKGCYYKGSKGIEDSGDITLN